MNFINKFRIFMNGRYGYDELYRFLFKVYLFILIIDLFVNFLPLSILELIIIIVMFYRFFSKNTYRRSLENRKYLELRDKLLNIFRKKHNSKNSSYMYKKCSKCKTVLRLHRPYKRGIKYVKCPKCGKRKRVLVLKRQKVDIVK